MAAEFNREEWDEVFMAADSRDAVAVSKALMLLAIEVHRLTQEVAKGNEPPPPKPKKEFNVGT